MLKIHDIKLIHDIDKEVENFKQNLPESSADVKICITIPAKNEELYLLDTLHALVNQKDEVEGIFDYSLFEILVLCHNCTDKTYAKALDFKRNHPNFQLHVLELNSDSINNIGAARRVLMHLATQRLLAADGWIVSTDADTIPSSSWLRTILVQPKHIDMVCGRINVNTSQLSDDVKSRLQAKLEYNLHKTQLECIITEDDRDSWPRHNHHSGPNMGVRKHVYLSVKGIPPIAFLEDIALFNRVRNAGYHVRHIDEMEVTTSGRLHSKTASGLGSELKAWTKSNEEYQVEGMEALVVRYRIYKLIRDVFRQYSTVLLERIATLSLIPFQEVKALHNSSAIYEQMIFKIEQVIENSASWKLTYPLIEIHEVNETLKEHLTCTDTIAFAIE